MVAGMIKFIMPLVFMMTILMPGTGRGEGLADPTRPPFGSNEGESVKTSTVRVKGLQTVMMSNKRCAAIIDGKTFALGDNYGNERLVEINEHGVLLQGARGRRMLALFPAVGMKIIEQQPQSKQAFTCKQKPDVQENKPEKKSVLKEKK